MKWIKDKHDIKRYKVDENNNLVAKLCSKCGRILSTNAFSPDKTKPYGVTPSCRECRNAVHRKTYKVKIEDPEYVQRHRDINNKSRGNYSEERKQELKDYNKVYFKGRWYDKNDPMRQRHLELTKDWYETEKGKERAAIVRHTRRVRIKKVDGKKLTREVIQAVEDICIQAYGELTCEYCKIPIWMTKKAYHLDHIIPVCDEGDNDEDNFNITCYFCNSSKGGKSLETFLKSASLRERKKEVRKLKKARNLRVL